MGFSGGAFQGGGRNRPLVEDTPVRYRHQSRIPVMPDSKPEQWARKNINRMFEAAGWVVRDLRQMNLAAALGATVRELPVIQGH